MIEFVAVVLAIVALVRVARLERELAALRRAQPPGAPARAPLPRHAPVCAPVPWPPDQVQTSPTAADELPDIASPPTAGAPVTAGADPWGAGEPHTTPPPAGAGAAIHGAPPGALAETLEGRIGERLLLYAGMLLVLFATAFFLRYAFENEWMSPAVQVAVGVAGGIAFVGGGERLARAGYRGYGLFLSGGGFAVLFLSIYAAYGVYALVGQVPAFVAMAGTAAAAAILADRQTSLPLAVMAVCGGFSAPFLVGEDTGAQVTLFTYDAILIASTMYLARRRDWPALNLASFVFTFVTVTAWLVDSYTPDRYLTTELFLTLFCAMFVVILRENLRAATPHARTVSAILWTAPAFYHVASVGVLYDHDVAFLVYVVLASAAVVLASVEARSGALRFIGWAAITLPFAVWVEGHQAPAWTASAIAVATGTWSIVLAPVLRMARRTEEIEPWDLRLIHASGLAVFGIVYVALVDLTTSTALAWIAALFAGINASAWMLLRQRTSSAVHFAGVACALAAVAVAIGFEGYWTVVMWAAEAAALVWVGLRARRFWFRVAGGVLFAIAVGVWLQSERPEADGAFLVLLNARALAGLFVIAALHLLGLLQRRADVAPPASAPAGPGPAPGLRPPEGARRVRGLRARASAASTLPYERAVTLVAAHALTVVLISLEIVSFWAIREGAGSDSALARELMLSSSWALYAGALIAIGMQRHYPPIRYFAIVLFALTVAKVLFVDIQQLDGIYRILAFFFVGAVLLVVSYLYARTTRRPGSR